MAHLLEHHIVPLLLLERHLGLFAQLGVEAQLFRQPRPPRMWWTTSAPVSSASIFGILLVKVKLLPRMRIRMTLLLARLFHCFQLPLYKARSGGTRLGRAMVLSDFAMKDSKIGP